MLESDLEFLRRHHADALGHSGGSLLDHLVGTAALLAEWSAPAHVVRAGLFHSVYGTGAFGDAAVAPTARAELVAQIGARAEALVHWFCTLERDSLYANAGRTDGIRARDRRTGAQVALHPDELDHLYHLACA